MFRYLAFLWHPENDIEDVTALSMRDRVARKGEQWTLGFEAPGLAVYWANASSHGSGPYFLPNRSGVVLGTLFERCPSTSETGCLSFAAASSVSVSDARDLVGCYWGRYVAFLSSPASRKRTVLRDPTGGLPCLVAVHAGVHVVCSRIVDCDDLGMKPCSINWNYVAAHSVVPMLESVETGLNGVSSVSPGHGLEFSQSGVCSRAYWDPVHFATSEPIENMDHAAALLLQTAKACTHAWASRHGSIIQHLSGGLDSSIVLGCLCDAPTKPSITCINYYSGTGDGDERHYARLAARRAGCSLIECERDPTNPLEPILRISRSARPQLLRNRDVYVDSRETQLARQLSATALFGGEGGDQLFYQNPVLLAAADCAIRHGPSKKLLNVAHDVARLNNLSIWKVLVSSLASGGKGNGMASWLSDPSTRLTTEETLRRALALNLGASHFDGVDCLPPGKRWHVRTLTIPQQFYSPLAHENDPEPIEPLVSQPLVELCLRIPTYLAVRRGWDRAVARMAFDAHVPSEILRRRTKGGIDRFVKDTLRNNSTFVRQLLQDGLLVQHGILDRAKLAEAIDPDSIHTRTSSDELCDHLTTEVWLRNWHARERTLSPSDQVPAESSRERSAC